MICFRDSEFTCIIGDNNDGEYCWGCTHPDDVSPKQVHILEILDELIKSSNERIEFLTDFRDKIRGCKQ